MPGKNVHYWRYVWGLVDVSPQVRADVERARELRRRGFTQLEIAEALGCGVMWAATLVAMSRTCQAEHNGHARHIPHVVVGGQFTCTCGATGEVLMDSYIEERRELVAEMAAAEMSIREIVDALDGAWSDQTIRLDLKALEQA